MNAIKDLYIGVRDALADNLSDVANLGWHILVPNHSPAFQAKRSYSLATGAVILASIIALKAFTSLPWQTFKALTAVTAIPLMGGLTGIPLLVYVGCTMAPPILFMITAVALSVIYRP